MDAVEIDRWQDEEVGVWRRRWDVPALRIFRRVGSTNDVARQMAESGAPDCSLVLAEEQTRGRGRRGREWSAPPDSSLSMSMVLRPPTPEASGILTLRLGLAAARALEQSFPLRVDLKWPNDLGLDGRKVGGILCEGTVVDDRVSHVIAGIGLNLRPPDAGWPAELASRATSIEESAGAPVDGHDLAGLVGRIVAGWRAVADEPAGSLSPEERSGFHARDALRGRPVTVDGRSAGIAEGVSAVGSLRVREDGAVTEITAGTVRAMDPLLGEWA